jgi:tRNA modification GTPase
MYLEDTIVAVATPPGPGGIGIVRVSGRDAERIAASVFQATRPAPEWKSHRLYRGRLVLQDGRHLDDALAVLMRAPHTYTGEDVLELHCHGSPYVLRRAVDTIVNAGARPAAAGEFTKRAFLNGKLDLAQAEAVADLVAARTVAGAALAAQQLEGGLSRRLAAIREQVIRLKAHLEVQIDFSDEDVGLDPALPLREIGAARAAVDELVRSFDRGRLVRDGLRLAIVGRPNAGKSTLLNALLGEERAIVTATPGTTRDVIEESADFDGVPVVLSDTAGLREAPEEVERIGVDRALAAARTADLILLVLDSSEPPAAVPSDLDGARIVAVLNKSDLPCRWGQHEIDELGRRHPVVKVSAKERLGLDDLRAVAVTQCGVVPRDGEPVLTRERHLQAMSAARDSLDHAADGVQRGLAPDLVAVDVQNALDAIAAVTGAVTSEDVLDSVFREFCIGK